MTTGIERTALAVIVTAAAATAAGCAWAGAPLVATVNLIGFLAVLGVVHVWSRATHRARSAQDSATSSEADPLARYGLTSESVTVERSDVPASQDVSGTAADSPPSESERLLCAALQSESVTFDAADVVVPRS